MPPVKGDPITVIKLNATRQEVWRYTGYILHRQDGCVILEALFDREDIPFHGIILGKGDRFVEMYFADHWYNIWEIHDRTDDHLKGWYCNVTRPAEITRNEIRYVDLALDLLVYPDNSYLVLDEEEFSELEISKEDQASARQALEQLINLAQKRQLPSQVS